MIYLVRKPGQRSISLFQAIYHQANLVSFLFFFFAEIINIAKEGTRADAVSLGFGQHFYYFPLVILTARVALHIMKNVCLNRLVVG